jgi:hypothetical protein
LEQSQIVYYDPENVPEARFSYDLSPMAVVVQKEGRKWYDYLTSLCAIIGTYSESKFVLSSPATRTVACTHT